MESKFKLSVEQVKENLAKLRAFMEEQKLDAFYVSSFDEYLNEYVPMSNCHRFYVTNFSGSVAEALVPKDGKLKLYVDGRYHEQADNECDTSIIEIVKVPANTGLRSCLEADITKGKYQHIGIEADRTSTNLFEYLNKNSQVKSFVNKELHQIIDFKSAPALPKITHLSKEVIGSTTGDKLEKIIKNKKHGHYITAIDSLAWVTNCRGYHLPNLSSFLGRGMVLHDKVYVFIDKGVDFECADSQVKFISCDLSEVETHLKKIQDEYQLEEVFIDKKMLNAADFLMLKNVFPEECLVNKAGGLVEFHSIKDTAEIKAIKSSFASADKAIFNTICSIKEQVTAGEDISEYDLYEKTSECYKAQGALELSFGTIAGVGANGSIIHYSDPKKDVKIQKESMILLDSGGYFETGFATDTTRTFMGANVAGSEKQKEIYTLVLKGILNLINAVFKPGTNGAGLDAICRQPLYQAGYDYAHGTGHGVGIHVHEGGVGIGPGRAYTLKPGQVVSIEPGIYIPGFGGVRIENIALIVEHPEFEGFLKFDNLVYIGYEPLLINESLLSEQEQAWLNDYEAECKKRGTSFR